ncbi:MAG TPA: CCA tRNA nucleotidyltransferase [Candidatus Thermoplasmatota archaeon]
MSTGARSALEEEVLAAVRPDAKETAALERLTQDLVRRCGEAAKFFGARAAPTPVGSQPKGTHLRGADVDVFLLFDTDVPLDEMRELGLKIAGSVLEEGETRYAEHPYMRGRVQGVRVDIVPAYAVRSARELKTAVDRTPFHNEFVRERLSTEQRDEVRLLKQFLKGVGAYGAELAVQGFSGYLCELMVIRFHSFAGVLEAAAGMREGVVLHIEGTVPPEVVQNARREFPEPLVFIDPVDPGRNVASALVLDNLAAFSLAAREYLREAKPAFFFPNRKPALGPAEVRALIAKRGTRLIGVGVHGSDAVDDVWVPQLRKSKRALEKLLVTYGFTVLRAEVFWGPDVLFVFELLSGELPTVSKHFGPAASHENARDFMDKWSGRANQLSKVYIEDGRLMVDTTREYTDAADLLRERAPDVGHGKGVAEAFREWFHVMEAEDVARSPYTEWASDFVQPGLPWTF